MAIIIEGIDNSGKSTLAQQIYSEMSLSSIIESEGPPKYPGEIEERIVRYSAFSSDTIFVRHPAVSQPIYGAVRGADPVNQALVDQFYRERHLFIYCDPMQRKLVGHAVKDDEDPKHLAAIERNYTFILLEYRRWAFRHAHILYRIGDDMTRVARFVRSTI